jgi:hypothetical protein
LVPWFGPLVAADPYDLNEREIKEETMASNHTQHDDRDREQQPSANPTEAMKQANPPRANVHPEQTAEVPHGTGSHSEPPGGGGRPSQRQRPEDARKP